jgi:hypothetical protein
VFWDPLGENRFLEFARKHLPYPDKFGQSPGERPLRYSDMTILRESFPIVRVREFELLSMVYRAVRCRPLFSTLEMIDDWLLGRFPSLKKYCRYVVTCVDR